MSTISRRIEVTDAPVIVSMQQMLRGKEGVLSLAQGIVHWSPPDEAMQAARAAVDEPNTSLYGADDGLPELRAALKLKLAEQNGIVASEVMVTAGANQAYTNVVLALLDAGDPAMLFRPYYFNHLMALQMTGSAAEVLLPPSTADMLPDIEQLRSEITARAADGRRQVKMVTLVNPGNPTGVMIPRATIEAFSELCAAHGVWLVLDNTYEHFSYAGEAAHSCLEAPHIINVFSFSKAYGMMGWRVGYVAFPPELSLHLLKAQDTIVICPAVMSQKVALGALQPGRAWVDERVVSHAGPEPQDQQTQASPATYTFEPHPGQAALAEQKALVLDALSPLGEGAVRGGSGAIYLFVRLPEGCADDVAVVRWLTEAHGVCLIPGSGCGLPGHVRVCYANLSLEKTREAATRLRAGLTELVAGGVDYTSGDKF